MILRELIKYTIIMSGHSKFKNIQHRKGAQDQKKSKIFTKIIREISTSIKHGDIDPNNNSRLRNALLSAKSANIPRERIDRVIKQIDKKDDKPYYELRYEGFILDGIGLIIEVLTDNKNRTAAEVRSIFNIYGGVLVETGNVSFMFDKLYFIKYPITNFNSGDELLEVILELEAIDIELDDEHYVIYVNIENFTEVINKLEFRFGAPSEVYLGWRAKDKIIIEDQSKAEKVLKLIAALEDSDDVQRIFGNYAINKSLISE